MNDRDRRADAEWFAKMTEEEIAEYMRSRGVEARVVPDEEMPEDVSIVTFFGEPRREPEVGEKVELRDAAGDWRGGYRCISEKTTDEEYPGEVVVWIAPESEWRAAIDEEREAGGAPWPLEQLTALGK